LVAGPYRNDTDCVMLNQRHPLVLIDRDNEDFRAMGDETYDTIVWTRVERAAAALPDQRP
jgi:hypothetical protein